MTRRKGSRGPKRTDRPASGVYVPYSVIGSIRRSDSSPLWLRLWALVALTADSSGHATFGATELRTMLQRKGDKQPLGIEQAESAVQRARSLGLIGESVGTTSFELGRNIVAGVEASVVR